MAICVSEDSIIIRLPFDFSAPSPPGYFDSLFTRRSSPLPQPNQLSETTSYVLSDLQISDPNTLIERITEISEDETESDIEFAHNHSSSNLYVQMTCIFPFYCHQQPLRSECNTSQYSQSLPKPPCPTPDFLKSLDTSFSMYSIPMVSDLVGNTDFPMWKILHQPTVKLSPGVFVQGRFGQGVITEFHHKDRQFHYFLCRTLNDGDILLLAQNDWYLAWWRKILSRLKILSFCTWL